VRSQLALMPEPEVAVFPALQSGQPVHDHSDVPVQSLANNTASLQISDHSHLTAIVLYSYEAIESNEVDLLEGETVSEIDQVDEGWWQGTTSAGHRGLFPANYVQLAEIPGAKEDASATFISATQHAETQDDPAPASPPENGLVATAVYSYAATEDNELSFNEGDIIISVQTISEDWWQGSLADGSSVGLFPATYVTLQPPPTAQ